MIEQIIKGNIRYKRRVDKIVKNGDRKCQENVQQKWKTITLISLFLYLILLLSDQQTTRNNTTQYYTILWSYAL